MPTLLIDTMLLTLFIVGTASRDYISKHRKLQPYGTIDFDILVDFVSRASDIIVTPNILTETSNWVKMIREPARSHVAETFQLLIGVFKEQYIASGEASLDVEFSRLWLTDSVSLRELANGHVLLTSDFDLYAAALQRGFRAVNFNDLRAAMPT
jgi:hypothetical protein